VLLAPTKLYYRIINEIINKRKIKIHGIAHITGGGFYENINRIISDSLDVVIKNKSWNVPFIFKILQEFGNISKKEMYRVFNMGIGMVIVISPDDFEEIKSVASMLKEDIYRIGVVTNGSGKVVIR